MNIEATLIFEVDDRYQHALDIEQAVDKSINETLQSEGVNSHMLTWSARQSKGSAEQQPITQVKTTPPATPVGEICRCDERDIWVAIFSNYDQLTTEYCPKCGKLLLT